MSEVKRKISILNVIDSPGELVEKVASLSYVTQRFSEKICPKSIKFASGRIIPFDQLNLTEDPKIDEVLPGYKKDDLRVIKIISPSYERVIKFLLAIGHHSIFRCCNVTFLLENITRKSALHFLRYGFVSTNMQSQKYKNQADFEYCLPEEYESSPSETQLIKTYMSHIQTMYNELKKTNLDSEWMRCVYPNNISQTMSFSTNFEQLRHMFDCLSDDVYVSENQMIVMSMLKLLKESSPSTSIFFNDFVLSEDGRSAVRRGSKYSRNKKVNWNLSDSKKQDFGLEVIAEQRGKETKIL